MDNKSFALNLIFSKICSILNDKKKVRACAIIFKQGKVTEYELSVFQKL